MKIDCPQCGSPIPHDHISLKEGAAQCPSCRTLFSLTELIVPGMEARASLLAADGETLRRGEAVTLPRGFERTMEYDGITIVRRWFHPLNLVLIPFSLFWNGFMVMWFAIAISQGEIMMAAMGSLHALVGLFLLYFTLARLFNRSTIKVTTGMLSVRHGPFPWPAPGIIRREEARQFYVRRRTTRGRGGSSTSYELRLACMDGRDLKITGGLSNPAQALYLEQELENHWGIENDESYQGG